MLTRNGKISASSWANDMAKNYLSAEISFSYGLSIDEDTAELALKAINLYCNQNNLMIEETLCEDRIGTKTRFVQRPYDYYKKENKQ